MEAPGEPKLGSARNAPFEHRKLKETEGKDGMWRWKLLHMRPLNPRIVSVPLIGLATIRISTSFSFGGGNVFIFNFKYLLGVAKLSEFETSSFQETLSFNHKNSSMFLKNLAGLLNCHNPAYQRNCIKSYQFLNTVKFK